MYYNIYIHCCFCHLTFYLLTIYLFTVYDIICTYVNIHVYTCLTYVHIDYIYIHWHTLNMRLYAYTLLICITAYLHVYIYYICSYDELGKPHLWKLRTLPFGSIARESPVGFRFHQMFFVHLSLGWLVVWPCMDCA
jgi:hypothetical protein